MSLPTLAYAPRAGVTRPILMVRPFGRSTSPGSMAAVAQAAVAPTAPTAATAPKIFSSCRRSSEDDAVGWSSVKLPPDTGGPDSVPPAFYPESSPTSTWRSRDLVETPEDDRPHRRFRIDDVEMVGIGRVQDRLVAG